MLQEVFKVFRNLKWIIAISLVISLALFLPAQVQELYRISAADGGWSAFKEFAAIGAIAFMIWFGAFQLATATWRDMGQPMGKILNLLRWLPIVLGVLPLLAAAGAQFLSMSNIEKLSTAEKDKLREVGNIFRIQENALADLDVALLVFAGLFVVGAIVFVLLARRAGKTTAQLSISANDAYFGRESFLLLTIGVIALGTAVFVTIPDTPAQWLETFGVVAIFTACVVAFSVHISLLTMKHRFPIFPFIFGWALLIALIGTNDNHYIRLLDPDPQAPPPPQRISARDAFISWMREPDRKDATQEYPVFIVTAQGGGIYAAQNAATFLARMQDLCPAFRRHLFAISSVSGGSVGAAIFATALHSADQSTIVTPETISRQARAQCDKIAEFLAGARTVPRMDLPGPIEQKVQAVLATDFLSPLVAASLFPDFTQGFVPAPIPAFDRARSLEYALENAADDLDVAQDENTYKVQGPVARTNLLKLDYQEHWRPGNGMPALLLNTTDAGSGKRVVIAPFDITRDHATGSDVCMLATVKRDKNTGAVKSSESLRFPLSTAAFISARFPWVSPAATVKVENACITRKDRARLVDGGYIDNSGVETALSLYDELEAVRKDPVSGVPRFQVYVISLTGGDFPDHGWFNFNDALEPIRALLSGRTSRAYIALNRAATEVAIAPAEVTVAPAEQVPHFPPFRRTDLRNHFYDLPLGWALSDKSRDIVSLNSGRFWDCKPDDKFLQLRKELSNADCAQIQVHHLLSGSTKAAFDSLKLAAKVRDDISTKVAYISDVPQKVSHEAVLACYEQIWFHERDQRLYLQRRKNWEARTDADKPARFAPYRERYLAYFQSERIRALLSEWDRYPETDHRLLAYLLASTSYDSAEFNRMTEKLTFTREADIPQSWRDRIAQAQIDVNTVLDNPEATANAVWGSPGNKFGNVPGSGDGWKYRSRGIYQIVGRDQYRKADTAMKRLNPALNVNILDFPDAVFDPTVAAKITIAHFDSWTYRTPAGESRSLVQLLKDPSLDWKAVRALQTDMDHSPLDQQRVAERSEMFMTCIGKAPTPPPDAISIASIRRIPDVFTHLVGLR